LKSSVEVPVYPIDVNPIEAYLIGKGVVEVSGCHRQDIQRMTAVAGLRGKKSTMKRKQAQEP
jgi:hypothetical protein